MLVLCVGLWVGCGLGGLGVLLCFSWRVWRLPRAGVWVFGFRGGFWLLDLILCVRLDVFLWVVDFLISCVCGTGSAFLGFKF